MHFLVYNVWATVLCGNANLFPSAPPFCQISRISSPSQYLAYLSVSVQYWKPSQPHPRKTRATCHQNISATHVNLLHLSSCCRFFFDIFFTVPSVFRANVSYHCVGLQCEHDGKLLCLPVCCVLSGHVPVMQWLCRLLCVRLSCRGGSRRVQHGLLNSSPQKGGRHRPENVEQQCNIFWPVRAFLWRVATFKSSPGAASNSESRVSGQVIAAKLCTAVTW